MAVIARLDDVTLAYAERVVLQNLTLDIVEGSITCIVGLSGAGKSTILRLLNGLRKPTHGRVFVKGQDLTQLTERELVNLRRSIGFSFQFAALFDSLNVYDNVALPLRENMHLQDDEIKPRVTEALETVGLAGTEEKYPAELSGGMVKRVGFARAIITNPEVVLYDEPTTGSDPIITHLLTDTIMHLRKKMNGTAVVVSHDLQSIFMMADYVAMLFEGAIIAYGTLAEMRSSINPIVQQFLQGSEVGPIPI
ncbi:MAG TPA: ATP-binding cassette domain-containing protein [Candidatus Baltobacteraceae bacterium]|jgi:phospholipid/cholesterol/gamma-HCH transport system ATP-binding protein